MNKAIHKRIMGILVIIFAFAIFTPKDVFAETCEEARSKFEETAFDKYGIIFDYNSDTNNYELSMNTATENSDILRNAGIVNPALKVTKMEITGNNNEKAVVTGSEITSILGKDILRAGGNSKIRFARRAISGVTPRIIEISLEPSNFKDPDLKTACGENANFSMKVSVTVDIGETMSPRKVSSYNLTPFESKYEKIDCSNYASKFKDTSFEYSYCKDMASAKAAGAKEYNYDSEHLTYASKYSDKAVFKCDYKVDGPTQSIFLEDGKTPNPNYYKNTKYLIGHGTFEVIAGTYEYHVEVAKGNVEAAKCEVSCDEVVTVEYGAPIAAGTPEEIANNQRVIQAYLGSED